MNDATYFRTAGSRRGWFARTVLYHRADRDLAELFTNPSPTGKDADEWIRKALAWTWRYVVPYERDPLAPRPTSEEVLRHMATHCEGYAVLLVDMAHAGLDARDGSRIRYVTGHRTGYRPHSWAQWTDVDGSVWMLDAGQSGEPIAGTGGWTIDTETIQIVRPV